jgi:cytochrome P450
MLWSNIPYLGFALEMGKRPLELLQECARGKDIYGILVAGQRMFIISDPHSTSVILKASNKQLSFEEFHDCILINFFGIEEKQIHSHIIDNDLLRKWYSQYLLSDKALGLLTNRLVSEIKLLFVEHMEQLNDNSNQDIVTKLYEFVGRFIFHGSVSSLFNHSESLDSEKAQMLFREFMNFDKALPISAAGISINYFAEAKKARDYLVSKCDTTLAKNMCELMTARREYFESLEKQYSFFRNQIAKNQVPLLWASVGNAMPATFWLLYYLLTHPEILADVRKEIDEIIPEAKALLQVSQKSEGEVLTMEKLNKLYLIDACITETLRLSSGSLIMRIVQEDDTELTLASGKTYKFRKGDRVGLCPPLFHFDENFFPDSKEFNPYRWIQGETEEQKAIAALGKIPLSRDGREVNW